MFTNIMQKIFEWVVTRTHKNDFAPPDTNRGLNSTQQGSREHWTFRLCPSPFFREMKI